MNINYTQYEYSPEKIAEAQANFTTFAMPDLSDLTFEDGFCPVIAAQPENDIHAHISRGEQWNAQQEAPQASRSIFATLLTAIINIIS